MNESTWLAALSERREVSLQLVQLDLRHTAGVLLARTRASWLGGIALFGAIIFFLISLRRSSRSRHRELEALRQRISRDLHDEIGSHLGSIRLMSELAIRDGSKDDSLPEIHRLAGEAAESMRGIVWLVREGDAPRLSSLIEAIRQSAGSLLKGHKWTLEAPTPDDAMTASLEFHRQMFLLFREAAHNINRHAGASLVKIAISWKAGQFHLRIEDNGCGFDANAVTAGNGLANLRHRASVLGGVLQIESEPGKGSCITLEVPFS